MGAMEVSVWPEVGHGIPRFKRTYSPRLGAMTVTDNPSFNRVLASGIKTKEIAAFRRESVKGRGAARMENRHRARLLIADDHTLMAEACKSLLEPEFQVLAIADNGRDLLRLAGELRPDAVVLDIAMPQLNGLSTAEQLKHMLPSCKLIFVTMNTAPDVAAEAFRRGASAYVVKSSTASELVTAIRRALRSESYLSPAITKDTVDFLLRSGTTSVGTEARLTKRQSEILQLLAEGMSMKEIASVLNVKPGTVAFHKYNLMQVLGVKNNAALVQYAIKHHLIG
jgi:DNA-binding NarL/FixJ family response regulator